jgi:hypothetical protein
MAKKRNSLVENINRRKRAGKSRPKSKSTVSKKSYKDMQKGWPKSGKKKASSKKSTKKKASKRKSTKKKTTR